MGVFVDEYCPHGAPVLSTMGLWGTLLGFIGYTPQFGCLGRLGYTGGTPHTYKTNPVGIRGQVWAHITPRGPLVPKPHRGGAAVCMFHKSGLPAAVEVGSRECY